MNAIKWLHPLQLQMNSSIAQITETNFVHPYKISKISAKNGKTSPKKSMNI